MNRTKTALAQLAAGIIVVCLRGLLLEHSTADLPVTQYLNSYKHGIIGTLASGIYLALEPAFSVLYTLVIAAILWRKTTLKHALAFGLTVAAAWLPTVGFKMLFERPRPAAYLLDFPTPVPTNDWSFPSGHTAFIVALAIATVLATKKFHKTAALVAVIVMLTPLICGLHYPSDVVVSALWASISVPALWPLMQGFLADNRFLARFE